MDVVKKHPNFRLFAAMNPSTDVGKRDLPVGIKNRSDNIISYKIFLNEFDTYQCSIAMQFKCHKMLHT